MFFSGKNRWDVDDYPEYVDDEAVVRRLEAGDPAEPMLRRKGEGKSKEAKGAEAQNGQFERRPPGIGGNGRPNGHQIEMISQQKYQEFSRPLEEIEENNQVGKGFGYGSKIYREVVRSNFL